MNIPKEIDTATLRSWLESGKKVTVLDVRPPHERAEWHIPGSVHINAYDKLKAGSDDALEGFYPDKSIPVVTVCAGGKTSLTAAAILTERGYDAYSLSQGMKGWSLAWNRATILFTGYEIIQLRRTGKGCLSYIVVSEHEAIIIDPSLPVNVYEDILLQNKWRLKAVMETHIHADHLSRAKQLAENTNAALYLPSPNKVVFGHQPVKGGQQIPVGNITLNVIATPGHTTESLSYLINNEVLFAGDTLFTNSIGRPDLKASDQETMRRAELLYDSLQLIAGMNDGITVFPAHSNMPVNFDNQPVMATLGEIKSRVSMLKLSKDDFVKTILAKLPPAPANFLVIAERNLAGDIAGINPADLEAGANRCAVS